MVRKFVFVLIIISIISMSSFVALDYVYAESNNKSNPQLENPLPISDVSPQGLSRYVGGVIRNILGVVGAIALALFVYGGFLWMFAGGNPDKVKKGKDVLMWATIGLILIFSSYAILRFVFNVITKVGN